MAKAKSAAPAAAGAFTLFKLPGTANNRIALNLGNADAIETDGAGHVFVYMGGNKHRIQTDASLEDLAGNAEPAE